MALAYRLFNRALARADKPAFIHALKYLAAMLADCFFGRQPEKIRRRFVPGGNVARSIDGEGRVRCAVNQFFDLSKPHSYNPIISIVDSDYCPDALKRQSLAGLPRLIRPLHTNHKNDEF
jgi:hypothetical protein